MHIKLEAKLLPLDTELERTLRKLKKVRFFESVAMAEQKEIQHNIFFLWQLTDLKDKELWKIFGGLLLEMMILQSSNLQLKQTILSLSLHSSPWSSRISLLGI